MSNKKSLFLSLKRLVVTYRLIFFVYIGIILAYVVFFGIYYNQTTAFFDARGGSDFGKSYASSLLEDIIFFGIIGLVTTIVTAQRAEDRNFVSRVRSLANKSNISDEARDSITEKVRALLAYYNEIKIRLKIVDYNETIKAYKIVAHIDYNVSNMCNDIDYKYLNFPVIVYPDGNVNGDFGRVFLVSVNDPETRVKSREYVDVVLDSNPFKKTIQLVIGKDSDRDWELNFTIWSTTDEDLNNEQAWYFLEVDKYVENVDLVIENLLPSGKTLHFEQKIHRFNNNSSSEINNYQNSIEWGKSLPLKKIPSLFEFDKIKFFFKP